MIRRELQKNRKRSCSSFLSLRYWYRETSDKKVDVKVDNEEEKTKTDAVQKEEKKVRILSCFLIARKKRRRRKKKKRRKRKMIKKRKK